MTAVDVTGLSRVFPGKGKGGASVTALDDVSLTVQKGEFVSLIGPSGCGKSTLLRMIADLDEPTSGSVTVFGKTARQARLDQDYGIVFQSAGLLPWRTVAQNIELPLHLHGVAGRKQRVAELMDLVGLSEFASSHPDQLSGGMQQRVAIAQVPRGAPGTSPHGRAVRCARRDDEGADAGRTRPHLRRDRGGRRVRHTLHP